VWSLLDVEPQTFAALVSAGSGLLGVLVGTYIGVLREWASERQQRDYLAIRVVCILDKFVQGCRKAVNQEGNQLEVPESSWPTKIEFPSDLPWKLLDRGPLYRILTLPSRVNEAAAQVSFTLENVSSETNPEHLGTVTNVFSPLMSDAERLANELRRRYNLPYR